MTTATSSQAVANAREAVTEGTFFEEGECLKAQRGFWQLDPKYPNALAAWEGSPDRVSFNGDPFSIPFGAPTFSIREDGSGVGHVYMSTAASPSGIRSTISTDVKRTGKCNSVAWDFYVRYWGHRILGYVRNFEGVDLPLGGPYQMPGNNPHLVHSIDLSKVQLAFKNDPSGVQGYESQGAEVGDMVYTIEHALASLKLLDPKYVDGSAGSMTAGPDGAYHDLQEKILGFHGSDANGIPGMESATWLGNRFEFTVNP
jgi:hypothetical protein